MLKLKLKLNLPLEPELVELPVPGEPASTSETLVADQAEIEYGIIISQFKHRIIVN